MGSASLLDTCLYNYMFPLVLALQDNTNDSMIFVLHHDLFLCCHIDCGEDKPY